MSLRAAQLGHAVAPQLTSGPVTASALSIPGNQLAATAVGNQASSTIAATR